MNGLDLLFQENQGKISKKRRVEIAKKHFVFHFGGGVFSMNSLREVLRFFYAICDRYKGIPLPVDLDLGEVHFSDKLVITLLECVCEHIIQTYRTDIRLYINPKGDIWTDGFYSSPLLLLMNRELVRRKEFCIKFEMEIYQRHFRRRFDGVEVPESYVQSKAFDDIVYFLNLFDLDVHDREDIAEIAMELVGNATGHTRSDCLLDIDVTRDYDKRNTEGKYVGINLSVVNFSRKLLSNAIQEKIMQDTEDVLGDRYQYVKSAYKNHAGHFGEAYTEQDFFTITAFQHKISGRMENNVTGGTGLTGLIKGLQQRSDSHSCYAVSGCRRLKFKPEYLVYNEDGWIGFNTTNDYLNKPPESGLLTKNDLIIPGTAFNLTFVMKRGNSNYGE